MFLFYSVVWLTNGLDTTLWYCAMLYTYTDIIIDHVQRRLDTYLFLSLTYLGRVTIEVFFAKTNQLNSKIQARYTLYKMSVTVKWEYVKFLINQGSTTSHTIKELKICLYILRQKLKLKMNHIGSIMQLKKTHDSHF